MASGDWRSVLRRSAAAVEGGAHRRSDHRAVLFDNWPAGCRDPWRFGLGGAVVLDPARARCPGSVGDFSWGGMASTFFWIDPVEKLSAVFFTQLSPSSSYPTRPQLKALVHAALTD